MPRFLPALRHAALLTMLLPAMPALAHEADKPQAALSAIDAEAQAAVAVVDAFSAALKAGEIDKAANFLHEDLLVLESGGAEHNRAQYLAEHAGADAGFLREASITPVSRRAEAEGNLAWVASESMIGYRKDGASKQVASTETMVLQREHGTWKIVHIHWSSRALVEPAANSAR